MWTIARSGARFETLQPGIRTRHSFSSGAHYDPANLSFGPVIACDEHQLDPGAGFELHPHARVELVSWVLDGALQHDDAMGRSRVVVPGQAQYQSAGIGIQHTERNASKSEPLHFVQMWMLTDEDVPDYDLARPPLTLSAGRFSVVRRVRDEPLPRADFVHAYVAQGRFTVGDDELVAGDSIRAIDEDLRVDGDGELLVLTLSAPG
jgi:redox-sensitive bicupin YhaK (pirin superfamily)